MEVTYVELQLEIVHDSVATVVEQYAPRVVTQTVFAIAMQALELVGIVFDKFAVLEAVADLEENLVAENEDAITVEVAAELY